MYVVRVKINYVEMIIQVGLALQDNIVKAGWREGALISSSPFIIQSYN